MESSITKQGDRFDQQDADFSGDEMEHSNPDGEYIEDGTELLGDEEGEEEQEEDQIQDSESIKPTWQDHQQMKDFLHFDFKRQNSKVMQPK